MISRLPFVTLLITIVVVSSCSEQAMESAETAVQDSPNIMLILADDLAYSDLGAYGSEIETPNIDLLAKQGVMFTRFHTSAMCSPSRAMLLTGVDQHKNGYGTMGEYLATDRGGSRVMKVT